MKVSLILLRRYKFRNVHQPAPELTSGIGKYTKVYMMIIIINQKLELYSKILNNFAGICKFARAVSSPKDGQDITKERRSSSLCSTARQVASPISRIRKALDGILLARNWCFQPRSSSGHSTTHIWRRLDVVQRRSGWSYDRRRQRQAGSHFIRSARA